MNYVLSVKVKGLKHSHTLKRNFDHKPSNAEVKTVVAEAKKALVDVSGDSTRVIDTTVTPTSKGDEEEALVA